MAATIPTRTRLKAASGALPARALIALCAAAGLCWIGFIARNGLQNTPADDLAVKLSSGFTFDPDTLETMAGRDDHHLLCDLKPMRERLAARLELMNVAIENAELDRIDTRALDVGEAADRLLACSPRDSFGWFARYVIQSRQRGITAQSTASLVASYRDGAREPWIAVRRNKLAVVIYPYLPTALQQAIRDEYADLLRAYLTDEAIDAFLLAGPAAKEALLQVLTTLSEPIRRQFVARAQIRGVDYDLTRYDDRPSRPWR